MHFLVSASVGVAASSECCQKVMGNVVGGLERVVFRGVAVQADAVAVAFVCFLVGDDIHDGLLSVCRRFWLVDRWHGRLIGSFSRVSHVR